MANVIKKDRRCFQEFPKIFRKALTRMAGSVLFTHVHHKSSMFLKLQYRFGCSLFFAASYYLN